MRKKKLGEILKHSLKWMTFTSILCCFSHYLDSSNPGLKSLMLTNNKGNNVLISQTSTLCSNDDNKECKGYSQIHDTVMKMNTDYYKQHNSPVVYSQQISTICEKYHQFNILCATKDTVVKYNRPMYIKGIRSPCFLLWQTVGFNGVEDRIEIVNDELKINKSGNYRIACLPAVYMVGFAKCGSTDLHYRLTTHQHIKGGQTKELRFWYGGFPTTQSKTTNPFYDKHINKTIYNVLAYTKMLGPGIVQIINEIRNKSLPNKFDVKKHDSFLSETLLLDSDITMYRHESIAGIARLVPNAKIIMIMRDPVEREFSFFRFLQPGRHKYVPKFKFSNDPQGFHRYVLHELRKKVPFAERSLPYEKKGLQSACYVNFVGNIFEKFRKDNVIAVKYEEYAKAPEKYIIDRILPRLELESFNIEAKKALAKLRNKTINQSGNHYEMLNSTRKLMQDYFRNCNNKLANLLKDNKWTWGY